MRLQRLALLVLSLGLLEATQAGAAPPCAVVNVGEQNSVVIGEIRAIEKKEPFHDKWILNVLLSPSQIRPVLIRYYPTEQARDAAYTVLAAQMQACSEAVNSVEKETSNAGQCPDRTIQSVHPVYHPCEFR